MRDEMLGLSEAARRLGKSEGTLRQWADDGRIPVQRDSANRRLFAAADVERLASEAQEQITQAVTDLRKWRTAKQRAKRA